MIFIQNGPSWKPKVIELLNNKLANGIIWDPREENFERIEQIKNDYSPLKKVFSIVDNKWYYKQFPNSDLKRLSKLDYIPDVTIDRFFLRDISTIRNYVTKCFEYQKLYNASVITSPMLYISDFDGRIIDRFLDILDVCYESKIEQSINIPIYISLVIHENAFNSEKDMNNFIEDISQYSDKFDGLYIVIDRENNDSIRHNFNSTRLSNIMNFNYSLHELGFSLTYGYCGLESLLYLVSGVDNIGTGWFYSLRRFNKEEKGLEIIDRQGRQIKRYTSIKLFAEVKMDETIFQANPNYKDEILDLIIGNTDLDQKIRNANDIEEITLNETYLQYFEVINEFHYKLNSINTIEEKVKYADKVLSDAIDNVTSYNDYEVLQKQTITHITNYKTALKKFIEDNYLY